jgi:hypothetical protein
MRTAWRRTKDLGPDDIACLACGRTLGQYLAGPRGAVLRLYCKRCNAHVPAVVPPIALAPDDTELLAIPAS